jgi:hypothetical protein
VADVCERWELTGRATFSFIRKSLLLGIIYIEKCCRDIRVVEKVVFRIFPGCLFFMLGIVTLATNDRLLKSVRSEHSEVYGLLGISRCFVRKAAHTEQLPGKGQSVQMFYRQPLCRMSLDTIDHIIDSADCPVWAFPRPLELALLRLDQSFAIRPDLLSR